MKQLCNMARNVFFSEYESRFGGGGVECKPMIEIIIGTVEPKQTPNGNADEFDNFRFLATPDGLRNLAGYLTKIADESEADLERILKEPTK